MTISEQDQIPDGQFPEHEGRSFHEGLRRWHKKLARREREQRERDMDREYDEQSCEDRI